MTKSLSPPSLKPVDWLFLAVSVGFLVYLFGFFGYLTAYGPHLTFAQSMGRLYGYEEWEHCALVPFIIAFLVWWKRKDLAAQSLRPSLIGMLPIALGLTLFWVSYRLDDIYFAFASLQILTAGFVIAFAGWAWMRVLFFPWLFLVFAWPLFFLDNVLAFPLRIVMSHMSTAVLNIIGVASVQVGTAIQSAPNPTTGTPRGALFQVDVADPCSGMRSLFALMMVSALYGFFATKTWWKHLALFAASLPLAILGNLTRILMLTFGILVMGPETAIGTEEDPSFFHMFSGFFVFLVALSGLLLIGALLEGRHKEWFAGFRQSLREASTQSRATPVEGSKVAGDIY